MAIPDEDLARRIRARDPRAFDAFFDRFAPGLLHYLAGMTGDHPTAEDLLQETVLRVHANIVRYEERGTFRAWVYRIATHLALTELRRRPARPAPLEGAALERPDPACADAGAAIDAERRGRVLEHGIAALPAEQRAVLLLRVREELDLRGIAAVLAIPEGTVKSRLHHAVRRLREFAAASESTPRGGSAS